MKTYHLRTTDYESLLMLGEALGVLSDGVATGGGYLDYIGEIRVPTGETDEDGFAITEPITDDQGVPYIHANLITPHNLLALAQASDNPQVQAALDDISQWFVTDENGQAKAPNNPYRVFAQRVTE
jgi:hypothetical protein